MLTFCINACQQFRGPCQLVVTLVLLIFNAACTNSACVFNILSTTNKRHHHHVNTYPQQQHRLQVSSLHDALQSDSTSMFTVCSVCESPFNTTLQAAAALAGLASCPFVSRRGSAVAPVQGTMFTTPFATLPLSLAVLQLDSSMSSSCMSISPSRIGRIIVFQITDLYIDRGLKPISGLGTTQNRRRTPASLPFRGTGGAH